MFPAAAGPFHQQLAGSSAQTPFQRLKPVCVELLSLTGRTTNPARTPQVITCLRRLKTTLLTLLTDDFSHEAGASMSRLVLHTGSSPLPPSLINYIFYPLSELISTAPKGIISLPDSIAELTLEVLALLCSQWWQAWVSNPSDKEWRVWCDLVILSSSVLGSPASKGANTAASHSRASDEAKLASLRVLSELLLPRFRSLHAPDSTRGVTEETGETEWEWDGISDLPLLGDDGEAGMPQEKNAPHRERSSRTGSDLVFPTAEHLSYAATDRVAKGAISFVLSSSFTIAESPQESTEARAAALGVAHNALLLWIGWACPLPLTNHGEEATWFEIPPLHHIELPPPASESESTAKDATAVRLRPLLPGITSTLTRLATSRLKSRQDGVSQKPTPSPVAATAIGFLGDLLRATLSDECLHEEIAQRTPLHRSQPHASSGWETSTKLTNLADFADFAAAMQDDTSGTADTSAKQSITFAANVSSSDPANKDAQWALSTLAQVHLALKTFSPLTQPSLAGTSLPSTVHASVQQAVLRLAVALLSECAKSFTWLDEQLEGMGTLNATSREASSDGSNTSSVNTLLTWIVDLASDHNSTTVAKCARDAFEALQRREQTADSNASFRIQLQNGSALWSVLTQALSGLPGPITGRNDNSASRLALRVSTVLAMLSEQTKTQSTGLAGLTKLFGDIQTNTVRLIRPLKVEQLTYVSEPAHMPGSSPTWRLQPVFTGLEASTAAQLSRMLFDLGHSLALLLIHELRIGASRQRATAEVFSMITSLIERAAHSRSVRVKGEDARRSDSVTSLVMAAEMLRGVSGSLDNLELGMQFGGSTQAAKQGRKAAHKLGKKVFAMVMDMLDGDAEEAIASRSALTKSNARRSELENSKESTRDVSVAEDNSSAHTLIERVKGISLAQDTIDSTTPARHGPVLDLAFVRAADLTKPSRHSSSSRDTQLAVHQAERALDISNALLFALLSSASKLLGQSFRPLLLRGSYPLISGMGAASDLVREVSAAAMRDIAFNTAYADVKNCLLDHADYILGSACQRLISGLDEELRAIALSNSNTTVLRVTAGTADENGVATVLQPLVSAQRAPFVLVEMIRVLGSEIIPMVEDAIDEILDALDRFHEHPNICDGLLAVLDSILETMASEQRSNRFSSTSHRLELLAAGVNRSQHNEKEEFAAWLGSRRREQSAFDYPAESESKKEDPSDAKEDKKEEEEEKPSKSQQVASQILTKAISFLSHPSPILRSRVLGLLRHGISTLAPQSRTAELLPIVNTAWPFVMSRLGPAYSSSKSTHQLPPIIHLEPHSDSRRKADKEWREVQGRFVERNPEVWVAAARFVEAAAMWVPEFVGKRVVEDAWPRFEVLLRTIRVQFDPRMQRNTKATLQHRAASAALTDGSDSKALLQTSSQPPSTGLIHDLSSNPPHNGHTKQTTAPHVHIEPPFILPSATSLAAQLTICIVTTLTTVVRHLSTRMADDAAWTITSHPLLLDLLDSRQPASVLRAAEELYTELGRRNPEATTWAIHAAFPKASTDAGFWYAGSATPCYMHHAGTVVHPSTVHCIVSGFDGC